MTDPKVVCRKWFTCSLMSVLCQSDSLNQQSLLIFCCPFLISLKLSWPSQKYLPLPYETFGSYFLSTTLSNLLGPSCMQTGVTGRKWLCRIREYRSISWNKAWDGSSQKSTCTCGGLVSVGFWCVGGREKMNDMQPMFPSSLFMKGVKDSVL